MAYLDNYPHDLLIVIRTAGERTAGLCEQIVRAQAPYSELHVIAEKPFLRAVRKTMQIGATSNARFLLALDADIVLYPEAMEYMMYEANLQDYEKFLRIDFWLNDKFRGKVMGVHLYNNLYSADFFGYLAGIDDNTYFVRPEGNNFIAFAKPTKLRYGYIADKIVGDHDYHQYYADLIRKYTLRYDRCVADGIIDDTIAHIASLRAAHPDDFDFVVADELLSARHAGKPINNMLGDLAIREKNPLDDDAVASIQAGLPAGSLMGDVRRSLRESLDERLRSYQATKTLLRKMYRLHGLCGKTAIYGTGDTCELLIAALDTPADAVIVPDGHSCEQSYHGIPVMTLDKAVGQGIDTIIVASITHGKEIRARIQNACPDNQLNIIWPEFL